MKKLNYFLSALFVFSIVFVSCENKDGDDNDEPYVATQADLNAAIQAIMTDITGSSFPHGGAVNDGDSTFRDIYANKAASGLSGEITKGTIVAKHTFKANTDGTKSDELLVTFAMIKREDGFDSDAADWEYVMMPNDGSADYGTNPNGVLPAVGNAMRGANVNNGGCKDCHAKAGGGDYLFVND